MNCLGRRNLCTAGSVGFSHCGFHSGVSTGVSGCLATSTRLDKRMRSGVTPCSSSACVVRNVAHVRPCCSPCTGSRRNGRCKLAGFRGPLTHSSTSISNCQGRHGGLFGNIFSLGCSVPFVPKLSTGILFSCLAGMRRFGAFTGRFGLCSCSGRSNGCGAIFAKGSPSGLAHGSCARRRGVLRFSLGCGHAFLSGRGIRTLFLCRRHRSLSSCLRTCHRFTVSTLSRVGSNSSGGGGGTNMTDRLTGTSFMKHVGCSCTDGCLFRFSFHRSNSTGFCGGGH